MLLGPLARFGHEYSFIYQDTWGVSGATGPFFFFFFLHMRVF